MNSHEARDLVDRILTAADRLQLNDLQAEIFLQIWAGGTSSSIAEKLGYKVDYINQVAAKLWKSLAICLDEPVSKKNIQAVLHRYDLQAKIDEELTDPRVRDWGESIDVSQFYGREAEIEMLAKWATEERCRSIGIFGLGGIGKTAFSIKLAQTIQADFDVVIWRSLRQAPTLKSLLENILPVLSGGEIGDLSLAKPLRMSIDNLLLQLRRQRCLILLDNIESMMESGEHSGGYLPGYEGYSHLLERICDESHQSCLVIGGREKPGLFNQREGDKLPVRCLQLQGLSSAAARQILIDKGSIATESQSQILIDRLGGNPLALKIVASNIHNLFNNDTAAFLAQGNTVFGSLWQLLDQQFQRFSLLQQQIMYWLAIVREGIQPADLQPKIVPSVSLPQVLAALVALRDRSAIETTEIGLTQQPVVMEYAIDRFTRNIVQEIITTQLDLFATHPLIEAKAPDYVRDTQTQIILYPIAQQLLQHFGTIEKLVLHLREILNGLRDQFTTMKSPKSPTSLRSRGFVIEANDLPNYSAGNLLNLLVHLNIDLQGWDFSHLRVRQAYLAQVLLRNTNFNGTHFLETVFAETFGSVIGIAYSPDGKLLATSGTSGDIKIWTTDTYQEILCCRGHQHWVMFVSFSPDSRYLASASDDYSVKLWDVATGQCMHTYLGHTDSVNVVVFSPDGKTIASGAQDSTIRLWQTSVDPQVSVLVGHKHGRVWSVAFSPDGQTLASGGEDRCIRLWDVATGTCLAAWTAHNYLVRSVAFSPDGQILASTGVECTIKLWNIHNHQCLQTWKGHQHNIVTSVAFSPDGARLASAGSDRTVKLWDTKNGKCLKTFYGHGVGIWILAYHPHGHQVASGGEDHAIKIWNLDTGACTKSLTGHTNAVLSLSVSPDQTLLASAHEDRLVRIWQIASGKIVHTLRNHTNMVWSVAWSHNGELLISGSSDDSIKLWQLSTGKLLQTFHGHRSWVWSVAFAPDNLRFASGSYDQTVKVWDIATGECIQNLLGHTYSVASLDFSPDGKLLASGSYDNTIRIWNLETGKCDRVLTDHENSVWSLKFSPDGRYLLSGSFDRTIKLWAVDTWECVRTYLGHQEFVKTVKFTPDGRQIVSGGFGGELKVWHVDSGECVNTLVGHLEVIYVVDVAMCKVADSTPPRLLAFSSSFDETIKVWDLESATCLDTWKTPRPYEGMSIDNITGINESQVASLKALGAI
jgi:WD40 repeat protein